MNTTKYSTLIMLILLATAMFSVVIVAAQDAPIEVIPTDQYPIVPNPNNPPSPPPTSQQNAIVVVAASGGGTTNPLPGAYTYGYGATITLQATASDGFKFQYWVIRGTYNLGNNVPPIQYPDNSATDPAWVPVFPSQSTVSQDSLVTSTNPLKVICGYGYTYVYEPVFVPTTPAPATSDAIVVVLNSIGGNTNPEPGTYHYLSNSTINLHATPKSGYTFSYWIAEGQDGHPTTFTDNPTNIVCGSGYTYTYQAMFTPTGTATSSSGISVEYYYAIIAVLAVIAVIALVLMVMYRGKIKK
jgi:hypothetical protein